MRNKLLYTLVCDTCSTEDLQKWWRQSSKYGRNSPTIFDWGDDIPFLAKLRLYLQNQGVDPADTAVDPPTGKWWRQIKVKNYVRNLF
ncbi:hypothetical protein RIR_jg39305.t1 [Rhizophagus irregularis DAOM 181602=DAOM 197198]|uniref:Uncharacterized protein n=1 Tax=Rhizophagus irregularis (strain DAOM 181602 / DAOM 197198 / MUCL 43194) TaxID=747089 RepID=U9U2R6_RHIID|nr:hypothetical protein RIR_jg39305.t1 [Rhizophagus irregularis DAOM 181602=DAOM 197198]